ncbi:hypothetical protein [Nonomuraea sp. NPDC052265]|uniref:hypothetical protein n=1 Tax=Nonomuraea sp. NPDC052265 TaxID=3364374 RepID=UPI0037CAE0B5
MAESSPHRDDRTPEEQALGSESPASACPSPDGRLPRARDTSTGAGAPDVCLEISEVRVEEFDEEGQDLHARLGGTEARATLRVRLDDVAHLIDRLLHAAPHLLDHLPPPPRTPRHALPTTSETPTSGTPASGTPMSGTRTSAALGGGAGEGSAREGDREDRVRRDWPRGGAPSWRPGRKHAGDLGAATARTTHHAIPAEEAVHTVPGREVLDVETHAGTNARPMTEQATRHSGASRPTPPTRPYFAPDEGTTPEPPSSDQGAMPSPTDRRSSPPQAPDRDPGPGRSKTPHTNVGPRPGLDPPPPAPPHPSLAHRIPAQPGPPPHPSPQRDHTPRGTAQPRPGRTPASPDTAPQGPAHPDATPEQANQPWSGGATAPREPALYRPGLDAPPQSDQPHDQGSRHARGTREPQTRRDRTTESRTRAGAGAGGGAGAGAGGGGGAGAGGGGGAVAENEGASGNGVASERLGGVAAGWS